MPGDGMSARATKLGQFRKQQEYIPSESYRNAGLWHDGLSVFANDLFQLERRQERRQKHVNAGKREPVAWALPTSKAKVAARVRLAPRISLRIELLRFPIRLGISGDRSRVGEDCRACWNEHALVHIILEALVWDDEWVQRQATQRLHHEVVEAFEAVAVLESGQARLATGAEHTVDFCLNFSLDLWVLGQEQHIGQDSAPGAVSSSDEHGTSRSFDICNGHLLRLAGLLILLELLPVRLHKRRRRIPSFNVFHIGIPRLVVDCLDSGTTFSCMPQRSRWVQPTRNEACEREDIHESSASNASIGGCVVGSFRHGTVGRILVGDLLAKGDAKDDTGGQEKSDLLPVFRIFNQ